MRILLFSSLYPNRVMPHHGLFVHRRAVAVSRRGVEMQVTAPVPFFPRGLSWGRWRHYGQVPPREGLAGIPIHHPRYPHVPGPGMYVQAWSLFRATLPKLKALRRKFDFQLIDSHYVYPDGVAAVWLAKALGVPCVITARGSDINLLPQFRLVRWQIRDALQKADALVAVSGALASRMRELGAPEERLHVVPNGIDRGHFHYGPAEEARRKLGIYSDEIMLLSVGNLNELKGHVLVIEALAALQERGIRASYHIIGSGPERARLEARTAELGLTDRVFLHGSLPNERLRTWYQAASLFVLASSREGWPNVLNEALACGLPCVATPVGGVPEIIRPHENGLLVERNVEALAEAIRAGLERDWDRRSLAAEAGSTSWSDVADRLVGLFAECTGESRPDSGDLATSPEEPPVLSEARPF